MADRIENYLADVSEQIRWRRARAGLETELRTHLLDQRDALIAQGMDPDAAEAESVRQMGDPVEVGRGLDRAHRPKAQWGLLALVGVILSAGVMIQHSAAMQSLSLAPSKRVVLLSVLLGAAGMLVLYFADYRWLGRRPVLVYIISMAALALFLVWCRWYSGSRALRYPAAWAALVLPTFCYAPLVWRLRRSGRPGLVLAILAALPMLLIAMIAPSLAAALVAGAACLAVLIGAVCSGWDRVSKKAGLIALALLVLAAAGGVLVQIGVSPYLLARLDTLLHPGEFSDGGGFWVLRIRELLAGAVWLGEGAVRDDYFAGRIDTDLWLAWVIGRMGWAVGLALIALLAALFVFAFRRCLRQRGPLGRLLSLSALTVLAAETAVYLAYDLGFPAVSPLVLPLLSTGGTYMVMNLALVGLILGVFREEQLPAGERQSRPAARRPLFLWRDGDLVIPVSQWKKAKE